MSKMKNHLYELERRANDVRKFLGDWGARVYLRHKKCPPDIINKIINKEL
jgi:hypothetical protein